MKTENWNPLAGSLGQAPPLKFREAPKLLKQYRETPHAENVFSSFMSKSELPQGVGFNYQSIFRRDENKSEPISLPAPACTVIEFSAMTQAVRSDPFFEDGRDGFGELEKQRKRIDDAWLEGDIAGYRRCCQNQRVVTEFGLEKAGSSHASAAIEPSHLRAVHHSLVRNGAGHDGPMFDENGDPILILFLTKTSSKFIVDQERSRRQIITCDDSELGLKIKSLGIDSAWDGFIHIILPDAALNREDGSEEMLVFNLRACSRLEPKNDGMNNPVVICEMDCEEGSTFPPKPTGRVFIYENVLAAWQPIITQFGWSILHVLPTTPQTQHAGPP